MTRLCCLYIIYVIHTRPDYVGQVVDKWSYRLRLYLTVVIVTGLFSLCEVKHRMFQALTRSLTNSIDFKVV